MGLLEGLKDEDRRSLVASARLRRFARDEVLFHEGDPANSLHLLVKGRVAVQVTTSSGDVATLDVIGAGEVLGELAVLPGSHQRSATARALEPTETLVISDETFRELRLEHEPVTEALLGALAEQIRRLSARLLEALYVPADRRVLRRLAELAGEYGKGAESGPVLIPLTQDDLAGLAGTTRETVNRTLHREAEGGTVALARGRITVLDAPRLMKAAR
jgi:CRP-like cAMP-binding protein